MKRTSAFAALLVGAALVVGACGSTASPSPSAATGTVCDQAKAANEPATTLLGSVCKAGKIRISTDPNYPPFSSLNATTNEYEGFDTDVAKLVAEKLGVTISWETPSWDALTAGNWGGRWDVSVGSMAQTVERAKVIDFTDPYYFALAFVAVPATSTATSLADLAGKSACVGSGTIYESWLKGEFVNQTAVAVSAQPPTGITVTSQETDNLCIEALAAGRSWDFFVQGKEFIQNAIDKGAKIKFLDNKWITAEQISIALDKAGLPTASMLAALNKIVADAHADGTLTAISKKWLNGVDVTVKQ
jgi:polar amino acid transport system substrate-binding protein